MHNATFQGIWYNLDINCSIQNTSQPFYDCVTSVFCHKIIWTRGFPSFQLFDSISKFIDTEGDIKRQKIYKSNSAGHSSA